MLKTIGKVLIYALILGVMGYIALRSLQRGCQLMP
jgi:hypothetical protein